MISLQRVGEIFKTIIRFCSLVGLVFDLDSQDYLLSVKPNHRNGHRGRTRYIPPAEGSQDPTKADPTKRVALVYASMMRISRTLVPVGPVAITSPSATKNE